MSDRENIMRVSVGVLTREHSVLICQRRPSDPHPLKWEFPGGKAQDGEDAATCLHRELHEELRIEATVGVELCQTSHTYPNGRTVMLTFFHVPTYTGEILNTQFETMAWIAPTQLCEFDFLEGDLTFVTTLSRGQYSFIFDNPQSTIHNPPTPACGPGRATGGEQSVDSQSAIPGPWPPTPGSQSL